MKFPEDTVVLVKPRMMVEFFAVYVNFMLVDGTGNPRPRNRTSACSMLMEEDASMCPQAAAHLEELLHSLEAQLSQTLPTKLVLVGFSKGAAVLNALLCESDAVNLWRRCEAIHFIDAGLTVPGVFPASQEDLGKLVNQLPEGFVLWLHFTPRQVEDEERPFVASEAIAFAERCKAAGVNVQRCDYFRGQPPSLDMHFDCLRSFKTSLADEDGECHAGFFRTWGLAHGEAPHKGLHHGRDNAAHGDLQSKVLGLPEVCTLFLVTPPHTDNSAGKRHSNKHNLQSPCARHGYESHAHLPLALQM
eukprot:2107881-Amphidinium_carterae.1